MLWMEGEVLKGHLDMIVLAAIEEGPAHGYASSSGSVAQRRAPRPARGIPCTRFCTVSNNEAAEEPLGDVRPPDDDGGSIP